jgi:hypothetical protein
MASHPLDGATAKLTRARQHLETFADGVQRYLDSDPVHVENRDEPEGDLRRIQWVASASTDPPDELGLIVGDWANNSRTALDYIVYELVRKETRQADPRWTHFPAVTDAADYPARARRQLRGAPAWSLPVFEGLQPFHDGADAPDHPLAVLAEISNRDKHRLIHAAAMQVAGTQGGISGAGVMEMHRFDQNPGTVLGDRMILDALLKTDSDDFEIHMDVQISVALQGYEFPAVDLMHIITEEVSVIVDWFRPALD